MRYYMMSCLVLTSSVQMCYEWVKFILGTDRIECNPTLYSSVYQKSDHKNLLTVSPPLSAISNDFTINSYQRL